MLHTERAARLAADTDSQRVPWQMLKPPRGDCSKSTMPLRRSRMAYPHRENIKGPLLLTHSGSPAESGAGLTLAIERGGLWKHESGTCVKPTPAGAERFT